MLDDLPILCFCEMIFMVEYGFCGIRVQVFGCIGALDCLLAGWSFRGQLV